MKKSITLLVLLCLFYGLDAQNKFTISGFVKDTSSGETLIGVNVFNLDNPSTGTTTNEYGFYSLTLPAGQYKLVFSYIGYNKNIQIFTLDRDLRLNVDMDEGIAIK